MRSRRDRRRQDGHRWCEGERARRHACILLDGMLPGGVHERVEEERQLGGSGVRVDDGAVGLPTWPSRERVGGRAAVDRLLPHADRCWCPRDRPRRQPEEEISPVPVEVLCLTGGVDGCVQAQGRQCPPRAAVWQNRGVQDVRGRNGCGVIAVANGTPRPGREVPIPEQRRPDWYANPEHALCLPPAPDCRVEVARSEPARRGSDRQHGDPVVPPWVLDDRGREGSSGETPGGDRRELVDGEVSCDGWLAHERGVAREQGEGPQVRGSRVDGGEAGGALRSTPKCEDEERP